jgi:hypothetical protein
MPRRIINNQNLCIATLTKNSISGLDSFDRNHNIVMVMHKYNEIDLNTIRGHTYLAVILKGITKKFLKKECPEIYVALKNALMTTGGKFIESVESI